MLPVRCLFRPRRRVRQGRYRWSAEGMDIICGRARGISAARCGSCRRPGLAHVSSIVDAQAGWWSAEQGCVGEADVARGVAGHGRALESMEGKARMSSRNVLSAASSSVPGIFCCGSWSRSCGGVNSAWRRIRRQHRFSRPARRSTRSSTRASVGTRTAAAAGGRCGKGGVDRCVSIEDGAAISTGAEVHGHAVPATRGRRRRLRSWRGEPRRHSSGWTAIRTTSSSRCSRGLRGQRLAAST